MPIHVHNPRTTTATVQPMREPQPSAGRPVFDLDQAITFGFGCMLVGFAVAWTIQQARVARLQARCARVTRRWTRAVERHDLSKQVIARMVDQEAKDHRQSVVA